MYTHQARINYSYGYQIVAIGRITFLTSVTYLFITFQRFSLHCVIFSCNLELFISHDFIYTFQYTMRCIYIRLYTPKDYFTNTCGEE